MQEGSTGNQTAAVQQQTSERTDGIASVAAGSKQQRQSSLLPMLGNTTMTKMTAWELKAAEQHLLRYVATSNIPFAAVDNPHFWDFVQVTLYNASNMRLARELVVKTGGLQHVIEMR